MTDDQEFMFPKKVQSQRNLENAFAFHVHALLEFHFYVSRIEYKSHKPVEVKHAFPEIVYLYSSHFGTQPRFYGFPKYFALLDAICLPITLQGLHKITQIDHILSTPHSTQAKD